MLEVYQKLFAASGEDVECIARLLEAPLESAPRLLADHPEISPRVRGRSKIRRRLLGHGNHLGLFYCVENRGIIIHALLDLRQDPKKIAQRLKGL